ncbi:MAG: ABC transporter ATP-binding protein [Actinomycetota bacterium]|nr:ABC transporter ATP-binding protein [Actinomycetota bacterium]
MMALLEVKGLRGGYGTLPVLHDVDLEVQEGETAVLLGSNGAGKTTTLLNICGMNRPWGGSVNFSGQQIAGKDTSALVEAGIVLVPEGRHVFPAFNVVKNLQMGAWTKRKNPKFISERMEQVFHYFPRLKERSAQFAGTLSGGEQQMLAIGRGLMADPKLLMIDEASLGLSPVLASTVFKIVKQINADGVTVVLVEQNTGAVAIADKTYVMEKGRIVFSGSGSEVLDSPEIREAYLGLPA